MLRQFAIHTPTNEDYLVLPIQSITAIIRRFPLKGLVGASMANAIGKTSVSRHGIGGILRSVLLRHRTTQDPTDVTNTNEAALRRMILLTLETVETFTIPGDDIDYRQFRADVRHLSERFNRERDPEDTLVLAGQFCSSMKDYFDRTSRFFSLQNTEYQKMVSMFTDTISSLNNSGQRTVEHLREIEQEVERATLIEDVRSLRVRLGECLSNIREEIDRQESITTELGSRLAQEQQIPAETVVDSHPIVQTDNDPVTGFPTAKQAETALLLALEHEHDSFVVPIIAKGAEKIYAQLGSEVGDSCLYKLAEKLRVLTNRGDHVFRWHGVAFLAILTRPATTTEVRREVYNVINAQRDESIQIGGRTIWLPVSVAWDVIAVKAPLSSLMSRINQFMHS
jgi:GGDEF domain-containing protein